MVQAHLFISGRVQGVFYRGTCREEARRRGLSGWVRNLQDGRVEAVLQGLPKSVEEMIRWCYRGPEEAQVADIDVSYEPVEEPLERFEIR